MTIKLIGLTGFAQSGKDTVGTYLTSLHGFTRVAFADPVREAALLINPMIRTDELGFVRLDTLVNTMGWDVAKTQYKEVRSLLQVVGTEVGRLIVGPNVWIDIAFKKIMEQKMDKVVITDVRFANEADAVRKHGGKVVRIHRNGVNRVNSHASESLDFESDAHIHNYGTLAQLFQCIDDHLLD